MGRTLAAWCLRLWAVDLVIFLTWFGALPPVALGAARTLAWSFPLLALVAGFGLPSSPRDPAAGGRWHVFPAFLHALLVAPLALFPALGLVGDSPGLKFGDLAGVALGGWLVIGLLLLPIFWLARRCEA